MTVIFDLYLRYSSTLEELQYLLHKEENEVTVLFSLDF